MKQAVLKEPGKIEFKEVQIPNNILPNEILLRIHKIGVCGSDVHVFHGNHPFVKEYPVVQGHEYSGEVIEVGSLVTKVEIGMKVTARPQIVCGICKSCLRGNYNICQNLQVQGFVAKGSAQEYFVVSEDRVVIVPDGVSYTQAAMIEPVAVGAHATLRAGSLSGKNVVVAGSGPIGNFIAQFAIVRGAKKVLMTTRKSDFRLNIANQCGIKETANLSKENFSNAVQRVFGNEGFQVGFEAAGDQGAVTDLISNAENGGTIIIVGVFEKNPIVNMGFLGEHELNVIGSMMYKQEDYEEAVALIANGSIKTNELVTTNFSFDDYLKAYEYIENEGDKSLKVIIDLC